MTLEFLGAAEQELAEATAFYEETEQGLGVRFWQEVQSAVGTIIIQPMLLRQRPEGDRRMNLAEFPYFVAYVLRGQRVYIIAVSHTARRPGYFRQRLRLPPAT